MVGTTRGRSPRDIAGALDFDPAYRMRFRIRIRPPALISSTRRMEGMVCVWIIEKTSTEHIECSTGARRPCPLHARPRYSPSTPFGTNGVSWWNHARSALDIKGALAFDHRQSESKGLSLARTSSSTPGGARQMKREPSHETLRN